MIDVLEEGAGFYPTVAASRASVTVVRDDRRIGRGLAVGVDRRAAVWRIRRLLRDHCPRSMVGEGDVCGAVPGGGMAVPFELAEQGGRTRVRKLIAEVPLCVLTRDGGYWR